MTKRQGLIIGLTAVVAALAGTAFLIVSPKASTDVINGIPVPPEPSPTVNDATLAGVDLNKNGVRDDVERKIAQQFGGTPDYSYAMAYAKVYQGEIVNPTPTTRHDALVVAAQEYCAADGGSIAVLNFPMGDTVVNTPARKTALRAFNDVLIGFGFLELRGLASCLK